MSKPHTFDNRGDCIYCGMSREESIQTQAMDYCRGNDIVPAGEGPIPYGNSPIEFYPVEDVRNFFEKIRPQDPDEKLKGMCEAGKHSQSDRGDWCVVCGHTGMEIVSAQGVGSNVLMAEEIPNDTPLEFGKSDKDESFYFEARIHSETLKVEVFVNGKWVYLENYRYQKHIEDHINFINYDPVTHYDAHGKAVHVLGVEPEVDAYNEKKADEKPEPEEDKLNYCSKGNGLSKCKAGKNWEEHTKCRFSKKASYEERCMYFREDSNHCDNHKAQKDSYLSLKSS